jgi:hypothetical protein
METRMDEQFGEMQARMIVAVARNDKKFTIIMERLNHPRSSRSSRSSRHQSGRSQGTSSVNSPHG